MPRGRKRKQEENSDTGKHEATTVKKEESANEDSVAKKKKDSSKSLTFRIEHWYVDDVCDGFCKLRQVNFPVLSLFASFDPLLNHRNVVIVSQRLLPMVRFQPPIPPKKNLNPHTPPILFRTQLIPPGIEGGIRFFGCLVLVIIFWYGFFGFCTQNCWVFGFGIQCSFHFSFFLNLVFSCY